jgi:hypothetical protein
MSIFCLAAVSPAVWGQAPVSKLNCNQPGLVVDDLVTFCQLREVTLPSADSFAVDTVNGGISVETWDGPGILVRTKVQTAAGNDFLAEVLAGQVVVDTSSKQSPELVRQARDLRPARHGRDRHERQRQYRRQ